MENNDTPTTLVDYAVALAAAHCEGCEQRCRRWRRRAAVRRCVALALVMVSALTLAGSVSSSLARDTWTTGASATDETVSVVRQMLNKQ